MDDILRGLLIGELINRQVGGIEKTTKLECPKCGNIAVWVDMQTYYKTDQTPDVIIGISGKSPEIILEVHYQCDKCGNEFCATWMPKKNG